MERTKFRYLINNSQLAPDRYLVHKKYNLFTWTHTSLGYVLRWKVLKVFSFIAVASFSSSRDLCETVSTGYARDGRIGRTRLAGPAGGRATLSNLRSIFHSRNSFAIQFSNVLLAMLNLPASRKIRSILKFPHRSNAFLFILLVLLAATKESRIKD